jgi:hypothetical protein
VIKENNWLKTDKIMAIGDNSQGILWSMDGLNDASIPFIIL